MSLLLEMFTYPFIVRAFVVGILVSLCAALLGVPLVLKRYSMIGDGLSHVSFGALSIAVACGWAPLPVSIPVVILAALGLSPRLDCVRLSQGANMLALFERLKELWYNRQPGEHPGQHFRQHQPGPHRDPDLPHHEQPRDPVRL